ncbi:LytTR family transcriptional regulator DNA-binding domain-containing protein [Fructobacillus sp. M1-13]|uniref:HTH LytTR-type domain-containing protein n=1 Tax=Fructobacillus papyriferae TaxID=2713171 RepID=A0ABS5QQB4_9LACO|nr:LytTR family transcriptional regulator DNA-binding domain-containing protein [Fructobacillus papyriferae]MBS9335122.1 hypothetical protein [Fructobacillus papyriferae]MCD2159208.1 LytTR family transcriptional regulator DNA-binding domain-containing protein [Fructobacillus papyriferae]
MACYILTDNTRDRRYFKRVLVDPYFYETPSAIIHALGRLKKGQVVILDSSIRGFESAGLQTAQLIRQHDPDAQLIMISDNATMAARCFEAQIGLLDFIIKKELSPSFFDRLLRAIAKANLNLRRIFELRPIPIRLPDGATTRVFDLTRIVYFTTDSGSHHLFVHETNHLTRIRANLRDLESVHSNLYRVHASYVINIAFLHTYQPHDHALTMVTGHRIPVSRNYSVALRKALRWPSPYRGLPQPIY